MFKKLLKQERKNFFKNKKIKNGTFYFIIGKIKF